MIGPLGLAGKGGRWPLIAAFVIAIVMAVVAAELISVFTPLPLPLIATLYLALGLALWWSFAGWVRWLHATGRSGFWALLGLVPYLGGIAMIGSLFLSRRSMPQGRFAAAPRYWIGTAILLVATLCIASRAFWTPYAIPSGSMAPALQSGDYAIATTSRAAPEPGDVIVFRPLSSPATDFVFRVVAVAGQRVQMRGGVLHLDGVPVATAEMPPYEEPKAPRGAAGSVPRCANDPVGLGGKCVKRRVRETLPNGVSYEVLDIGPSQFDDTLEHVVPAGHVFVLGDNRDNGRDSRLSSAVGGMGDVPIGLVRARMRVVAFDGGTRRPSWRALR